MISNFLRKLNPYSGYMGGGGGDSGGGGGGSYDSFDAEFDAAIAQDEANKASGGGGVSYGDSGYVGSDSGSSSSDIGGATAPTVYTANDGSIYTSATDRDAHNNALFEAEVTQRVNSGFETFYNDYLTQIETEKGYYTSDDITNALDAAIASIDPTEASYLSVNTDSLANNYLTDAVTEVDFNTLYETLLNDLSSEKGYYTADDINTAYGLAEQYLNPMDGQMAINQVGLSDDVLKAIDYATEAEKIIGEPINIEPLIGAPDESGGYFDWLTSMFGDNYDPDSDVAKTFAVEDFDASSILAGSQFKIDDSGVLVRQTDTTTKEYTQEELNNIQRQDIGIYLDYTGNTDKFDAEDLSYAWTPKTIELYGDNSLGFQEFAKDIEEMQQNLTGFSAITGIPLIDPAMKPITLPKDGINPETGEVIPAGTVAYADPLSIQGITANIGDAIANGIIGFFTGGLFGDLAYGLTQSNTTALGTAMLTDKLVRLAKPIDNTIYLTPNGGVMLEQSLFGKTEYIPLESVYENLLQADNTANEALNTAVSSGSNDSFNVGSSIASGINASDPDSLNVSGSSWRDHYNFSLNPKDIIQQVISPAVNIDPELVKAAEYAQKINNGEDYVGAALSTYGDALIEQLPDGWEQPTETALRIMAGESAVQVIGDVYGQELGIDSPLDKAALEGLTVYDKTGNLQSAAESALITYVKEGGEFPDFKLPEYFEGLDFSLPDLDFSGIDLSFPDLGIDFEGLREMIGDINIPNIDFSGVKFPELNIDLPSLADLGVDISGIDFSDMSFPDFNLTLPDLSQYNLSLEDVNWDGVAWPDLGISFADLGSFEGVDWPSVDFSGVSIKDVDIPLPELADFGIDVGSFDWSGVNLDVDFPDLELPDIPSLSMSQFASLDSEFDNKSFEWQVDAPEEESLARKLLTAKLV